jgi:hypothetical protein
MDHRREGGVRIYIAGPISSNLSGYKAEFAAAEAKLRAEGFDTINPADNPPQADWTAYMRLSLTQLVMCDGIALLPGWEASAGARLELHVASKLDFIVIYLKPPAPSAIAEEARAEVE